MEKGYEISKPESTILIRYFNNFNCCWSIITCTMNSEF